MTSPPHDSYNRLLSYLDELQMFGIKLGLEQTTLLFNLAGAPLAGKYLHIAGTNGKGSVGAMLDAALRGVGFRTGFYSSPHLVDVRERFRIDGRPVGKAEFTAAAAVIRDAAETIRRRGGSPTYFEFTTALAALLFKQAKADFIIWETGMGGRFDATSVVEPEAAIITHIDLDHQQYLGDTIAQIAFEKAGIIRAGRPVFAAAQTPEAQTVIAERSAALDAPLTAAEPEAAISAPAYGRDAGGLYQEFDHRGRTIRLYLAGAMQRRNFALVHPVLAHLAKAYDFNLDQALDALRFARWPGRCQELTPRLIIDGGHNPDAARALVEALTEACPGEKFSIIFAGFRDKDVESNLRILAPLAADFIFMKLADSRPSCGGEELTAMLRKFSGLPAVAAAGPEEALRLAAGRPTRALATGSLYLLGEILAAAAPDAAMNDHEIPRSAH